MWQNLQVWKIEREVYLNHNYLFLQNQHKLLDYFSRKVIPKPCSTTSGMEEEKRGPRVCSEVLSKLLSGLMSSAFILKGENKTEYKLKGRRGAANGGERAWKAHRDSGNVWGWGSLVTSLRTTAPDSPDYFSFSVDDPGFSMLDTSPKSASLLSIGLGPFLYSLKHNCHKTVVFSKLN